jgi:hypothetical protein
VRRDLLPHGSPRPCHRCQRSPAWTAPGSAWRTASP